MVELRNGCKDCKYQTTSNMSGCLEGQSPKYNKRNCPYYSEYHLSDYTEYDIDQLLIPVVKMILYNWGIRLVQDGENTYDIRLVDDRLFKKRLCEELSKGENFLEG